jgi:hypothetical protein
MRENIDLGNFAADRGVLGYGNKTSSIGDLLRPSLFATFTI